MENGDLTERMKEIYEEITSLTDEVCRTQLNDEYAELARQMTELLASFSESPLGRGKREIWAAGIVYALGYVNFLFDTYRDPYLSADERRASENSLRPILPSSHSTYKNRISTD